MCKRPEEEGHGLSDEGLARWRKGFVCLTQLVWLSMPPEQRKEEPGMIMSLCESVATLVQNNQVPAAGALIRRVASLFGSPVVYIPGLLPKENMPSARTQQAPLVHCKSNKAGDQPPCRCTTTNS